MQSQESSETAPQGHITKPSVNGELGAFVQQNGFHMSRPSVGSFRDRNGAASMSINTNRASALNPSDMQTPGTGYDMNFTPLLPSQLLVGSPFQPGSPSTFASPHFQNFTSFQPGPASHMQQMGSPVQNHTAPMYQSMMAPTGQYGPVQQQNPYGAYGAYGSQMQMAPGLVSGTSRTVYLGNIPPETSAEEILGHVRSGQIESVRLLPDKNCAFISFLDGSSAVHFHSDAILKKLSIRGQDIKIGWGKPSQVPSSVALAVQQSGASRNVYLGNLPAEITEDEIREDLGKFGPIDTIKLVREKNIGFVHFLSISNAVKTVTQLPQEANWQPPRRVFYGKDRCAYVSKTQQQNAAQYLGIAPGYAHVLNSADRDLISSALAQQSVAAAAVATAAGGVNNLGNRTVYLGNIHPETTAEEICNVVRGGLLHHVRYIPDKHICFVTFIDPTSAASFFALSNMQGLMIHNRRLKIGWGKHSGALPPAIALAVSGGASRNVYIGNIDEAWSEDKLRQDFSEYGEIELINFLREKSCAFVNFTNIANAIKAIEAIRGKEEYKRFKINFGKDRCGNAPRQVHNSNQQMQQQNGNQADGVASPHQNGSLQPNRNGPSPANSGQSSNPGPGPAQSNGVGHHSHSPSMFGSGSGNPLTMYLSQMSQQQAQQQQQQYHEQMQQQQQSYLQNGQAGPGYFHQPSHSVSFTNGQVTPSSMAGSLEPPSQPHYTSHGSSNSFSVNTGRGPGAAPTMGGMLAPMSAAAKAQHARALSMPAFSQIPFGQQGMQQQQQMGIGSLASGLGGLSIDGSVNGHGLAMQGDSNLPRWTEEAPVGS